MSPLQGIVQLWNKSFIGDINIFVCVNTCVHTHRCTKACSACWSWDLPLVRVMVLLPSDGGLDKTAEIQFYKYF